MTEETTPTPLETLIDSDAFAEVLEAITELQAEHFMSSAGMHLTAILTGMTNLQTHHQRQVVEVIEPVAPIADDE